MSAPTPSKLDGNQVLQGAYDEAEGKLRVAADITTTISGAQEVIISHEDDSIRLGDGTNLVTATQESGKTGLDVNVLNNIDVSPHGLTTAIKTTVITVGDTAVKIPSTALANRNTMSVRVWGANVVYFGDSSVTSVSGYPKRQFEEMILDIRDTAGVELWAVCESGTSCEVRILEIA